MKYILFEGPDFRPTVRIFDEITSHNEVRAEVHSGSPGFRVVSAGKIWFGDATGCTCIHSSVSLGMAFDEVKGEEASEIIRKILKFSV
jgi:hypothetical protein